MERTLINELKENKESKISGFATKIRDTKYMIFVILRDRTGFIQVSLDKNEQSDLCEKLNNVIAGSVIEFTGKIPF